MPYRHMYLIQAGEGGHDAGFVQLYFKRWDLIELLFIRSHVSRDSRHSKIEGTGANNINQAKNVEA